MHRRTLLQAGISGLAGIAGTLSSLPALADGSWPTGKLITYIVPFPAGGTTDVLGRLIAQKLGAALGTTVVVDNKGGAGGSVGSEVASRAAPDGYTLLGGTISSHAINVSLYPRIGYDPIKSFLPVTLIGTNPVVLVVPQSSPYETLKDILEASKAKPGGLSSASAGTGTSQHLALELLSYKSGVKFTHVPYKGNAPAVMALVSNEVQAGILATPGLLPQVQGGKVRALAVTGSQRSPLLPQVPTVGELGLPDLQFEVRYLAMVPAATPETVMQTLRGALQSALAQPELKERLAALDMVALGETGSAAANRLAASSLRYGKLVKASGIKAE